MNFPNELIEFGSYSDWTCKYCYLNLKKLSEFSESAISPQKDLPLKKRKSASAKK